MHSKEIPWWEKEELWAEPEIEEEANHDSVDESDSESTECSEKCKESSEPYSKGEGEKKVEDENQDEMWRNYITLKVEDVLGKEFRGYEDAYKQWRNPHCLSKLSQPL